MEERDCSEEEEEEDEEEGLDREEEEVAGVAEVGVLRDERL